MPDLKKSEVIEDILSTVLTISGRKTTKGHAIYTMSNLLKHLEPKYNFLKDVRVNDNRFSEDEDPITVMTDINNIPSNELGKAIQDIIKTMNHTLGSGAGHFFIKEIRKKLDEDHISSIESMGVDLSIMQLQSEIERIEKSIANKQ